MVLDSRIKKGVYSAIVKGTSVMEDPELVLWSVGQIGSMGHSLLTLSLEEPFPYNLSGRTVFQ